MKKEHINFNFVISFMLLLISYIFSIKFIYIAPNLNISLGLLIYPFTFLILALMYNNKNITEVKESIYFNFLLIIIFYIIISILNSLDSITSTELISSNLRNIFTPNYLIIKNFILYYPDLINLLTFIVVYFLTHYIFITVFEVIKVNINSPVAFILAILISFILDQMIYVPLTNLHSLINLEITYQNLIEYMTANFIAVIFTSILMLSFYLIKKRKNLN